MAGAEWVNSLTSFPTVSAPLPYLSLCQADFSFLKTIFTWQEWSWESQGLRELLKERSQLLQQPVKGSVGG